MSQHIIASYPMNLVLRIGMVWKSYRIFLLDIFFVFLFFHFAGLVFEFLPHGSYKYLKVSLDLHSDIPMDCNLHFLSEYS